MHVIQTGFPSPLAGEGCGGLASGSELSRSWARGPRRKARSARALSLSGARFGSKPLGVRQPLRILQYGALTSARTYRCATPHPTSAKLGLASLSLRILLPQG